MAIPLSNSGRKLIVIALIVFAGLWLGLGIQQYRIEHSASPYNGDTLPIDAQSWQKMGEGAYPLSTWGDLGCVDNAVYFFPENSFNETAVGLPLNQIARDTITQQHWQVTVPNVIKPNADLAKLVAKGLAICQYNAVKHSG